MNYRYQHIIFQTRFFSSAPKEKLYWRFVVFLLTVVLLGVVKVQGQDLQMIDSLEKEVGYAKEDSNKTRLYYRIWQQYRNNDMEKATYYARIGLAHARKVKWDKGIAAFYTSIGEGFDNQRANDSAIFYYNKAIDIYQKIDFPKGLAGVYNNMSVLYGNSADYVKAIEYSFKGLPIVLNIKDTSYASVIYNNIGKFYYNQQNYPKASEYILKALNMAESAGFREKMGDSYSLLAMIYLAQKDSVRSLIHFEKAIRLFEESQNLISLAETYSNLSALKNDYREKLQYSFKARALFDSLELTSHLMSITNFGNIGVDYFDLVRFKDKIGVKRGDIIPKNDNELLALAEQYLTRSVNLSREFLEFENLYHFLKVLGELEEYKGNSTQALEYYKESYALSDSLFSQENKNRIAELESQREIEHRDKELAIKRLELNNARRTRVALICGAGLLFVIGGLLFYQNRTRRKTNAALLQLNKKLEEANRIKARFFGILSHDLRGPVANLAHFLQLQQDAPDLIDAERTKDHQQKLVISTENLLGTMETVLLWSKSQMERFAPQKKMVMVKELFETLKKYVSENTNIAITFNDPDNLCVYTDEDYLSTIMYNLQANAIKALKNTVNPKIEWAAVKEKESVIISISDNGPGIPKEQADVLYNKESVISAKQGLGLHIIRDMAEAINCSISIHVNGSNGSKVKLIL